MSEAYPPLEQMRLRLEALFMLDVETRRKRGINDEEFRRSLEVYSVILAFEDVSERFEAGYRMVSVPFIQRTEIETQRAFDGWLDIRALEPILAHKKNLTPETAQELRTLFCSRMMPWVLTVTSRVADAIQMQEFDQAASGVKALTGATGAT